MSGIEDYTETSTLGRLYELYRLRTRSLREDAEKLSRGGVITVRVNDISCLRIQRNGFELMRDR